jgi:large subunit ribosomal protein L15
VYFRGAKKTERINYMNLSSLTKNKGMRRKGKRLGRGIGSGKGGHTVGRGTKGQKARRGSKFTVGFEGGQVPLYKRLPHLGGFNNRRSKKIGTVSLNTFNRFEAGTKITPESLIDLGIFKKLPKDGVKILAGGRLGKKLILSGFLYSDSAMDEIKKSGSEIND